MATLDTAPEDLSDKLSTELMALDPDSVKTNKCTVTQLSETNRYKINYSKARLTDICQLSDEELNYAKKSTNYCIQTKFSIILDPLLRCLPRLLTEV